MTYADEERATEHSLEVQSRDDRDTNRTLLGASVGIGIAALLAAIGGLGVVIARDHQRSAPLPPPPVIVSARPPASVSPSAVPSSPVSTVGYLRVDGTAGAVVFEDGRSIGAVPLLRESKPGPHNLRIVDRSGRAYTTTIWIRNGEITDVAALFAPATRPKGGAISPPPPSPTAPSTASSVIRDLIHAEQELGGALLPHE